jgi:hypothetical protein
MTTTESAQARNEAQLRQLIADQTRGPLAPLRRVAKGKKLHSSCKASKRIYDLAGGSERLSRLRSGSPERRSRSRTLPRL